MILYFLGVLQNDLVGEKSPWTYSPTTSGATTAFLDALNLSFALNSNAFFNDFGFTAIPEASRSLQKPVGWTYAPEVFITYKSLGSGFNP